MGNYHLYKIECVLTLGTRESERLKVTALNLFHPTASPLFQNVGFFHIATWSRWGESKRSDHGGKGEGKFQIFLFSFYGDLRMSNVV